MNKKIILFLLIFLLAIIFLVSYFIFNYNYKNIIDTQKEKALGSIIKNEEVPKKVSEEVSLIAVGDISFSRGVERIVKRENNINYPFLKIADYLKSADLVFGNLETSIMEGREITDREMVFRSNPGTEQAIKEANISIVSLANNHTPNFGQKGLMDTFEYLKHADIKFVGAGENEQEAYSPLYIDKNGLKFAFLAYNDVDVVPVSYEAKKNLAGTAFMKKDKMIKAVKEAKLIADFVIVSMHSGNEYVAKPNNSQVYFAHAAIDAGADLIIGHHPHVVQTMEEYKGKFIFYSLGNFVFDEMWVKETLNELAVKVYFTKAGVQKISFFPITAKNISQPEKADEVNAEKILKRLKFPLETGEGGEKYITESASN